mgnify:FL=1
MYLLVGIAILFILYNIISIGLEKEESNNQILPDVGVRNENRKRNSTQN